MKIVIELNEGLVNRIVADQPVELCIVVDTTEGGVVDDSRVVDLPEGDTGTIDGYNVEVSPDAVAAYEKVLDGD